MPVAGIAAKHVEEVRIVLSINGDADQFERLQKKIYIYIRMPKLRFTENVVEYYSWSYKCCSKNKLVSWLSCVAPAALNLKIHPNYYRLTY